MFKTDQESFWAGEFGNEYINRNCSKEILSSSLNMFAKVFDSTQKVESVLEFGPNIGINLQAIRQLKPGIVLAGVEINSKAAEILNETGFVSVFNKSILEFETDRKYDFVFTRGVLIHINPQELKKVYAKMYEYSNKYILVAEYYNPSPVAIPYRGESDKLFKRDFAGEILDMYSDLELVSYGFEYHRDNNYPQDDITWFLLRKV